MHDISERNKSEWFTIYMTRLFVFFITTLWDFEGNKNKLFDLCKKTTIVAKGKIPGPKESLLNLIQ